MTPPTGIGCGRPISQDQLMSMTPPSPLPDVPGSARDGGSVGNDVPAALRRELTRISRTATDHVSLQRALVDIARITVGYVGGADGVGTTLNLDGQMVMTGSDQTWVIEIDAVQYGLGQGPCLTAADTGTTVCTNDLPRDGRWPRFSAATAALEVGSVLSLPLLGADVTVGCLNVYARRPGAFEPQAVEDGNRFAHHAAVAVRNAQLLTVTRTLAAQLDHSLADLAEIALRTDPHDDRRVVPWPSTRRRQGPRPPD